MPSICFTQLASSLQVFGDRALHSRRRIRIAGLDHRGKAAMPFGAIGLQLRFVGDRADQGMMERIFRRRGEPHLIDQLRPQQVIEGRLDFQRVRRSGRNRNPITAAALTCAWPRVEPVDACADGGLHRAGHGDFGYVGSTDIIPTLAVEHPPLGQLAHHFLREERIPGDSGRYRRGQIRRWKDRARATR